MNFLRVMLFAVLALTASSCRMRDGSLTKNSNDAGRQFLLYWAVNEPGQNEMICRAACDGLDLKASVNEVRKNCNAAQVKAANASFFAKNSKLLQAFRDAKILVTTQTPVIKDAEKAFIGEEAILSNGDCFRDNAISGHGLIYPVDADIIPAADGSWWRRDGL